MMKFLAAALFVLLTAPILVAQGSLASRMDDLIESGQYDEAIAELEPMYEKTPDDADINYWLGAAIGMKAQNAGALKGASLARKTRKHFERAVELNPDHMDARSALVQYYMQAPKFLGGGKKKAVEMAREIYARDKDAGDYVLINALESTKAFDEAESLMVETAKRRDTKEGRMELGFFYQRREMFDKAFWVFTTLNAADYPPAAYQIGRTAVFADQRLADGIDALLGYLNTDPQEGQPGLDHANYRLGQLYKASGDKEKARAAFEACLAINPDHKEAKKEL